jgi:LPXTG-site transpeptidase (sortase) family protein
MDLSRLFNQILPQATAFLGVFFVVMMIGYGFLYFVNFVPEEPKAAETITEEEEISEEAEASGDSTPTYVEPVDDEFNDPLPKSITLSPLGRTVTVLNPTSRSVANLDAALLKGVVRHPDSADLLDPNGNILILGHSSYLKNVFNKNFQAFNGIQNLKWGDTITLRSSEALYTYRVERVYEAKASAVMVPTRSSQPKLTLATCDTFGAKEDRFIVEAVLVAKKAL